MMSYNDFAEKIATIIREEMGENYKVEISEILKNNSTIQKQLFIREKDAEVCPAIYLQDYYNEYRQNLTEETLKQIVENIIQAYKCNDKNANFLVGCVSGFGDYQYVKEMIVFKLVNTEHNQELLKMVPHIPYLDLSIIFYLCISVDEKGQMSALIKNEHMEKWDVTVEELYKEAKVNTPLLLPHEFSSLTDVMMNLMDTLEKKETIEALSILNEPKLYILTNNSGVNGAASILYPKVLSDIADQFKRDLIILPSSIHETLLVPYEEQLNMSVEEMSEMVQSINCNEVPVEDRLSDHVYRYMREEKQVVIA